MREFRPPVRPSVIRSAFGVVLTVLMLGFAGVMVTLATGSYRITYLFEHGTLTVDSGSRFDGERVVPVTLLRERRVVSLRGGRRTHGTAMTGYCTGRWSYPELGSVWQATGCTAQGVLLVTADGDLPIVVSPPDPEAFLAALDAGTDFSIVLPPADATPIRVLPLAGALVAVLVGLMVGSLVLLGPSRMVYRIGEGRLEVSTLFGSRSWTLAAMRARAHHPNVTLRVAGTSLPGYHTGLFRVDGESTRLYATDLKRGVLLEGPARVYLSPEDVGGFLDALRAAGVHVEG